MEFKINRPEIEEIVREAGAMALQDFRAGVDSATKGDGDHVATVVTETDRRVETFLLESLTPLFPDHQFVGEEHGSQGPDDADFAWYIDPIDGTGNFARSSPLWGISVGVAHQKRPILGAMFLPAGDEYFVGDLDRGAFLNGKPIQVSDRPLSESYYMTGRLYAGKKPMYSPGLAMESAHLQGLSCAVFIGSQIARGAPGLYTSKTAQPHDLCAAVAIVEAAGGVSVDRNGAPWRTDSEGFVMMAPSIVSQVMQILKEEDFFA